MLEGQLLALPLFYSGAKEIKRIFGKMQTERNLIEDLKHQYKHGGMTIRLIIFNVAVFLLIQIASVFGRLIGGEVELQVNSILNSIFALNIDFSQFIHKPWGLFTSIFAHFSILHLLFNMLFLYSAGKFFESMFDQKRMIYTYLFGGIVGGMIELIAHLVFPALSGQAVVIVGASGSVMAIFSALAFHRPNLMVNVFNLFSIRLIFIAGIFILIDLVSLGLDDGTAHFAHLGGALFGMLSVYNYNSSSNLLNRLQMLGDRISRFFKTLFSSNKKLKVRKGGAYQNPRFKSDEEYNVEKKQKQAKTDAILDKISKSGYESLTKAEKEFLFSQSKNG
jgi:membrane associated rhomboid family serine protease